MPILVYSRRRLLWLGVLLLTVLAVTLLILPNQVSIALPGLKRFPAYRLTIDGRFVGYVEAPDHVAEAVLTIQESEERRRGYPVVIANHVVAEKIELKEPPDVLRGADLLQAIARNLNLTARGVAVVVDDRPVVVLPTEEQARAAVNQMIRSYRQQIENGELPAPGQNRIDETVTVESIEPVETIQYKTVQVDPEQLKSTAAAVEVLARGTDERVIHTVQNGESLWTIAQNNEMTVEELQQANPQIEDPKALQPGDQVSLIVPTPYITLRSVETRQFRQRIPFETRIEKDPNLYPWEEYVKQPGEYGERAVVERVERLAGKIVAAETIQEQIIREPQVQVVVRGSKDAPYVGTGSFRWPLNGGRLTDRFGWSGWRNRNHDGIDIAAPRGTPVYAADTGVVTSAGWNGDYGRTVVIDHGGGKRVTLYAHLSSIAVSVGQRVEKGDLIGRVGSTGFATGSHLHFEIHVNGRAVDPMRYFSRGP